MERSRSLELTFVGRTYMMFLYVIATVFLLLILGAVLNNIGEHPNESFNLYIAVGLWISFIAGGIVYEWHRIAFKRLGMRRKSVRISLPLIFLLLNGVPIIFISALPYHPIIRLICSALVVISLFAIWKAFSMAIRNRLRSVREREF